MSLKDMGGGSKRSKAVLGACIMCKKEKDMYLVVWRFDARKVVLLGRWSSICFMELVLKH